MQLGHPCGCGLLMCLHDHVYCTKRRPKMTTNKLLSARLSYGGNFV